jgi:Cdc6-like AAA superfamily ATPase
MKKASTIRDIYNIFDPQSYLKQDTKNYYIDIYKDFTDDLHDRLELSDSEETIFVAGQSGNGKSSALQLFSTNYPDLNDYYDIKILNGRNVFTEKDIDVADVLLMIAFTIIEENENLKTEFLDVLEDMRKKKLNELEEIEEKTNSNSTSEKGDLISGFKINLGLLKIGMDFKDTFKVDNQNKKVIRELIKLKKKDFIDKINEIIRKYKRDILKEEKRLLLIIDDIEKIKDSDHIFTDEMSTILQIECSKIITMPIYLKRINTFAGYVAKEISFKLKTRDNEFIPQNIEKLEDIITARLEDSDLIDKDAKELIAKKSGGNIRQLIKIVRESAIKANRNRSETIILDDVKNALHDLKRDYSSASMEIKDFLDFIKENKNPQDYNDDSMKKLKIATNQSLIFAYYNGEIWYDLNPIILDDE